MTRLSRPSFVLAGLVLVLMMTSTACKKKNKTDDGALEGGLRIPEYFKNIPSDTPYLLASIQSIPYDQLEWNVMQNYGQSIAVMRKSMQESASYYGSEAEVPRDTRVAMAILDELDGRMTPAGIKELGLTTNGHVALYGIGIFPALRIELDDPAKVEAMIKRVEAKVGEQLPTQTFETYTFRYVHDDDVMIPIILTDSELLIGVTHDKFAPDFLGYLTGSKKPTKSLYDDNRLLAMQKKYDMLPYMSGYFDVQALSSVLLGDDTSSLLASSIISTNDRMPTISAVCKPELQKLAADMPRFVFGYTSVARDNIKAVGGLEVTNDLPQRLMAMKANAPGYGDEQRKQALFAMSLGLNLDRTIEVLRNEAQKIGANPYRCEDLAWINQSAEEFYFNAQQVPPFARTLLGTTFILNDFAMEDQQLTKLQLALLLNSADPESFFTALKAFFPEQLGALNLMPDGQPVSMMLPPELTMQMPGIPTPMLTMTRQSLAMSMGPGMQDVVSKGIQSPQGVPTPLLSMTYNLNRIAQIVQNFINNSPSMSQEDRENMSTMFRSYENFGPSTVAFDITERGFFFNIDTSLVPKQ